MLMMTQDQIEDLYAQIKRRYWLFSAGYVFFALGTAISVGMFSIPLGIACFFAEIAFFCYVNMVNTGAAKDRLEQTRQRIEQHLQNSALEVPEKTENVAPSGQYL